MLVSLFSIAAGGANCSSRIFKTAVSPTLCLLHIIRGKISAGFAAAAAAAAGYRQACRESLSSLGNYF